MSKENKKYYQENRSEFDQVEKAPAGLWGKIDSALDADSTAEKDPLENLNESKEAELQGSENKVRRLRLPAWLKSAAVFLVIFSAGFLFAQNMKSGVSIDDFMADQHPEMYEAEKYYSNHIQEVKIELTNASETDKVLVEEFMKEHELLDKVYDELKIMLKENVNSDRVINMMLSNLQMRLEVLQKQKQILENIKSIKSGKNETKTL